MRLDDDPIFLPASLTVVQRNKMTRPKVGVTGKIPVRAVKRKEAELGKAATTSTTTTLKKRRKKIDTI